MESGLSILESRYKIDAMQKLGVLVRAARDARNMKAYQLAEAVGKKPSFVSRLETGEMKETPSPEDLAAISGVLGIPVRDMLAAAGYDLGDRDSYALPPIAARIVELMKNMTEKELKLVLANAEFAAELAADRRAAGLEQARTKRQAG